MNVKRVLRSILGYCMVLCFIFTTYITIRWIIKMKNYSKEYVYSDSGNLYYEKDGEKIYIDKLYNSKGEDLKLEIPDKKTIIMYCYKDNPKEGIFLDINNTSDSGLQHPIINLCVAIFILAFGLYFLTKKNYSNPIYKYYYFYVCFSIVGTVMLVTQISKIVNYNNIKNNYNIVNSTIYSDLYEVGAAGGQYKAVSYYYVDGIKYVYADEIFVDGDINDAIGKTQEIYYNPNNPEEAYGQINSVNKLFIVLGIFLIIISAPSVFFRKLMAERYEEVMSNAND